MSMRFPPFAAALLTAALAACGTGSEPTPAGTSQAATEVAVVREKSAASASDATPPSADDPADACGAGKLDRWLNVLPTDTVKAEIASTVGERPIRYYGPNDPITMDYNPERLNGELGEDGRIKLFRCG
jgi:hypothetical protein